MISLGSRFAAIALLSAAMLAGGWWYHATQMFPYQARAMLHFYTHREAMDALADEFERHADAERFVCYPELGRLTFERAEDANQPEAPALDPQFVASFNSLCANAGMMFGLAGPRGVLIPMGGDERWDRGIDIYYARLLGPSTAPRCDAAVTKASAGMGYCDVRLDDRWVIHYQWFAPDDARGAP